MPGLPTGTVTFLFTDIEGSTRLLQQLGDHYADVLAEYRRCLRSAIEQNGGDEVDTQGDALFAAFPRAKDALAAAVAAQQTMYGHPWPDGGQVRARMGLHTGEPWAPTRVTWAWMCTARPASAPRGTEDRFSCPKRCVSLSRTPYRTGYRSGTWASIC